MKKFCITLLSTFLVILAGTAHAAGMTLTEAKQAGLIGERDDGLVAAVVPNPSPDIAGLVVSTNNGRMDVYKETAVAQNIPIGDVRKIAAQKIFAMAAKGDYLMSGGQWARK